jgi:hypothetical protein
MPEEGAIRAACITGTLECPNGSEASTATEDLASDGADGGHSTNEKAAPAEGAASDLGRKPSPTVLPRTGVARTQKGCAGYISLLLTGPHTPSATTIPTRPQEPSILGETASLPAAAVQSQHDAHGLSANL